MKVLFIQPPVHDFYQTTMRTQPLGLAYLAAVVRHEGHEVALLDCQSPHVRTPAPLPEFFSYLRKYYPTADLSPFRLYARYYRFGLSAAAITEYLQHMQPEVVGISCQFTPYVQDTIALAALVKSLSPSTVVIVGGAHASALPAQVLSNPFIDYAVIGEGERTIGALLASIQRGDAPDQLDGIAFKNGREIRIRPLKNFIENLDELPFPARDLLDMHSYTIHGQPYTMLLTSRGCPRACTYCSVATVMGRTVRLRSPENIVAEMLVCVGQYGIRVFDIEDDHFTVDPQRALDILDLVIKTFGENTLDLYARNGVSLLSLNKKLLTTMKRAGFKKLDGALGGTTPAEGHLMQRTVNRRKTETVLRHAQRLGIPSTTYIILGMPGQRLGDMIAGIQYVAGLPTLIGPSIFYPSPGSAMYARLHRTGALPKDFALMRSSAFPVETPQCSRSDCVTLVRMTRWINWIKQMLARAHVPCISVDMLVHDERFCHALPPALVEKVVQGGSAMLCVDSLLQRDAVGRLLTGILVQHHLVCGLRRIKRRGSQGYTYELFCYETAQTVIKKLFESPSTLVIAAPVAAGQG